MFGRRILAAAAFVAAVSAQLTITNPTPSSWWVAGSENTIAWTCDTSPYSAYTIVLTNTNSSILNAPFSLVADIPNYDCSFTVNAQQSSQQVSNTYTVELVNILNLTDVYASSQFSIEPFGSTYPSSSSSSSSASSGTATSSAGSSSSTSTSSKSGAAANYIPVGMSMVAAIALGLVVA